MAAKHEKNNAKSPRPVPKKFPVNAGTEDAPATPANLGVPTPELPFDPHTAGAAGAPPAAAPGPLGDMPPGAPGSSLTANAADVSNAMLPNMPPREPFPQHPRAISQVLGMIHHWPVPDLLALMQHVGQLLSAQGVEPGSVPAGPGESPEEGAGAPQAPSETPE